MKEGSFVFAWIAGILIILIGGQLLDLNLILLGWVLCLPAILKAWINLWRGK